MVYQKTKELQQVNQRLMIMDKTKNDFLRLLSHEMRTPLNGIFGIMDIVFDQITKNDGNTQLYKHFANSRERILRIIDDSLMLAKFELYENGENMAVYPLKQIISEAIVKSRSLATEKKISLNLKNVFYETDIKSDKNMLIKALQSYIMSLVNISNPGRTIDISIEKNSNIQIILMLQGEKLSESFISSFFEIFVTNDTLCPGGYWGLESALGYRIISMLNGKTTIENRDPDSVCLIVEPNSN
jgi:K+-sensing histidine kinase KdpD